MTRTGRALVIGPVVVLGLSLTAVAAAPAEPRPAVVEPIAAHPPASAEAAEVLTLPFLADIVAPLKFHITFMNGGSAQFRKQSRPCLIRVAFRSVGSVHNICIGNAVLFEKFRDCEPEIVL